LLLESTASLVLCVDDVQQLCKRLLLNTLKQFVKQNLEQPDLPNSELSPNELVNDTLQLLVQMLGSQDISLLPNNMVEAEHKEIADALIFPLIEYCEKSAVLIPISSQSHIQLMDDQYINDTVDSSFMSPSATYLTNCLCAIEASLSKIPFGNFHREYIASKLDTCLNSLVSAQFSYVIKRTGLSHIDETLKESKPGTYTKAKFSNLLKDFNAYLSNPDELLLPEVNKIYAQKLKRLVRRRSADQIHCYYQSVYQTMVDMSTPLPNEDVAAELYSPQQVAELILNF
ncbi:unnamed protein product, partial [Trichobilharzia regenti]